MLKYICSKVYTCTPGLVAADVFRNDKVQRVGRWWYELNTLEPCPKLRLSSQSRKTRLTIHMLHLQNMGPWGQKKEEPGYFNGAGDCRCIGGETCDSCCFGCLDGFRMPDWDADFRSVRTAAKLGVHQPNVA